MESLESLTARKRELEKELEKLTVKKYGSSPWVSGIQDQFESNSYSYTEYTDPQKAYKIRDELDRVNVDIYTYADRAKKERDSAIALTESQKPKYEYMESGSVKTTTNPAIAARKEAQNRFFGMSKVRQTIARVTGQKKRFVKLWYKVNTEDPAKQQAIANELNKMFR